MEEVARKIQKGITLSVKDLQIWAEYNYLILPDEEQQIIQNFIWRKSRVNTFIAVCYPVLGFGAFAVNKFAWNITFVPNTVICLGLFGLTYKAFNYGINKDRFEAYTRMYNNYKDEVQDSKYRGLKLYGGRYASQVKERQYTSSVLDDMRVILNKNK